MWMFGSNGTAVDPSVEFTAGPEGGPFDENGRITPKRREPTRLEREAAERYNAMNRHDRRAFDARAKKLMKQAKR
jgi:hypothetical protein